MRQNIRAVLSRIVGPIPSREPPKLETVPESDGSPYHQACQGCTKFLPEVERILEEQWNGRDRQILCLPFLPNLAVCTEKPCFFYRLWKDDGDGAWFMRFFYVRSDGTFGAMYIVYRAAMWSWNINQYPCHYSTKASIQSTSLRRMVESVLGRRPDSALEQESDDSGFEVLHSELATDHDLLLHHPFVRHSSIDYEVLKRWLANCSLCHGPSCATSTRSLALDLMVLDCIDGNLVLLPLGGVYVALSYVWGSPASEVNESPDNASDVQPNAPSAPFAGLPQTIMDTVTVTRSLGFRYLWVDRLCVPADGPKRHEQINNMDQIYQNAVVTIVAAANTSAYDGLPGVSSRKRTAQSFLRLPSCSLMTITTSAWEAKSQSKWASRGWTYQEDVLSRRKLIFADDRVYFECRSLSCIESMCEVSIVTTDHVHEPRSTTNSETGDFQLDIPLEYPPGGITALWSAHIPNYSKRSLTYDRDALAAFQGTLRDAQRCGHITGHRFGIPLANVENLPLGRPDSDPGRQHFIESLLWTMSTPGRRRQQFPSWSWLGWHGGEVKFPMDITYPETRLEGERIEAGVSFKHQSGTFLGSEIGSRISEDPFLAPILAISARTISFQLTSLNAKGPLGFPYSRGNRYAKLQIFKQCPDVFLCVAIKLDAELPAMDISSRSECNGLLLKSDSSSDFGVLLVQRRSPGAFERVGTFDHFAIRGSPDAALWSRADREGLRSLMLALDNKSAGEPEWSCTCGSTDVSGDGCGESCGWAGVVWTHGSPQDLLVTLIMAFLEAAPKRSTDLH